MDANPKASLYIQWVEPEASGPLSDQEAERLPAQLPQPLGRGAMIAVTHYVKDDQNASDLALLRAGMTVDNEPQMSALCRRIRRIPQTKPREFPICRLSARVPKAGTNILAQGYSRFTTPAPTSW